MERVILFWVVVVIVGVRRKVLWVMVEIARVTVRVVIVPPVFIGVPVGVVGMMKVIRVTSWVIWVIDRLVLVVMDDNWTTNTLTAAPALPIHLLVG